MDQERDATPRAAGPARPIAFVTISAFAVGILTSVGQGTLPFEMSSLANSAGSWSLAAFLLCLCNTAPRRGLVLGFLALAAMLAGYIVATELRGYATGTALWLFWGTAAIVAGPALGVAAAWVRGIDRSRIAAGAAVIAGILVGEGAYGLTRIADTTSSAYWMVQITVGLAIVVVVSVFRLRRPGPIALCGLLTAAIAALLYGVYSAI
jgi:FtsH-binding integral membrane protein